MAEMEPRDIKQVTAFPRVSSIGVPSLHKQEGGNEGPDGQCKWPTRPNRWRCSRRSHCDSASEIDGSSVPSQTRERDEGPDGLM